MQDFVCVLGTPPLAEAIDGDLLFLNQGDELDLKTPTISQASNSTRDRDKLPENKGEFELKSTSLFCGSYFSAYFSPL